MRVKELLLYAFNMFYTPAIIVMKKYCYLQLLLLLLSSSLSAQENRILIEKKGGHLYSTWVLNDNIRANVFIESGYPKIIFSKSFIEQHLDALNVRLEQPADSIYVSFWSDGKRYKVLHTINGTMKINGIGLTIDALVVDTDEIPSWGDRDILFPISDLQKRVELNIGKGYMRILDDSEIISEEYVAFDVSKDHFTKALYLTTTLKAFDADGKWEEVSGNFQLDLGAGNAFMLNKNQPEVQAFIQAVDRMLLKDTTQIKGPKGMDISVVMSDKVRLSNVEIDKGFIVGLKYRGKNSNLYTGSIGPSFFQHFTIIFDFESSKFYLKPTSDKVTIIK